MIDTKWDATKNQAEIILLDDKKFLLKFENFETYSLFIGALEQYIKKSVQDNFTTSQDMFIKLMNFKKEGN